MYILLYIMDMLKRYSVAQARAKLPTILDEIESGGEVELTRRGKPIAVVVSIDEFERITSGRRDFAKAYAEFRARYGSVEREHLENLRDRGAGRKVAL